MWRKLLAEVMVVAAAVVAEEDVVVEEEEMETEIAGGVEILEMNNGVDIITVITDFY